MLDRSKLSAIDERGETPGGVAEATRYEHLLVREILHRVNNEFASAVGVISRTTSRAIGVEAKIALGVVADCIHAQARLNRALQMRDGGSTIDATDYFRELCEALVEARLASTQVNLTLSAGLCGSRATFAGRSA